MEDNPIIRRSAPKASIRTYSRKRIEEPPRKKRRLQDLSSSEINLIRLPEPSQRVPDSQGRAVEKLNNVHDVNKRRRRHDPSTVENCLETVTGSQQTTNKDQTPSTSIHDRTSSVDDTQDLHSLEPTDSTTPLTQPSRDPLRSSQLLNTSTNSSSTSPQQPLSLPSQNHSTKHTQAIDLKKGSIRNYFKPVAASSISIYTPPSSSPSSRVSIPSDLPETSSTPPSSPPSSNDSFQAVPNKIRKRPRRLRTRILPKMNPLDREYGAGDSDDETLQGISGGEELDHHLDLEELRDLDMSEYDSRSISDRQRTTKTSARVQKKNVEKGRALSAGNPSSYSSGGSGSSGSQGSFNRERSGSQPIDMPKGRARTSGGDWKRQTVLNYAKNSFATCPKCNFVFLPSLSEDATAHSRFCLAKSVGEQPRLKDSDFLHRRIDLSGDVHTIMVVKSGDSDAKRTFAEQALEISYQDLGGPPIEEFKLWDLISHHERENIPRFKVYIYCLNKEVVGIVLAESIEEGGQFYRGDMAFTGNGLISPVKVATGFESYVSYDKTFPVFVCIDRIWVNSKYRLRGFAANLVDVVREDFVTNMELTKVQIAFSVPTDAGFEFASRYCRGVDYSRGADHIKGTRAQFLVNPKDSPDLMLDSKLQENYAARN